MSNKKVSVIMPFHNGEEYLNETLKCLFEQTLENFEIICVDDGSTDDTVKRLKKYEKKHPEMTVLEQKKANAGVARNLGMSRADGEYLIFLDSDDLFDKNMLKKMYEACKECDADVCVCNANQYDETAKRYINKPQYLRENLLPKQIPFSKDTIGKYILYFTTSVPWNKMIKKEFIDANGLKFQDIERANDQYFSVMTLLLAKKITIVREKLVHYRIKQKENLTAKFSRTPLCAYESMLTIKKTLDETGFIDNPDTRCAFDNKVINLMIYSLNIQSTIEGYKTLYDVLRNEGFEKLGITLHEKEYYFNPLEYENFKNIMNYSYDEYLLLKNYEYRDIINRKNLQYSDLMKRFYNEKKDTRIMGGLIRRCRRIFGK